MKLIKIKNKEQLLKIGYVCNNFGDIVPKSNSGITLLGDKMHDDLVDKIVIANDNKDFAAGWEIGEWMIERELDPNDYPEYFI